MLNFFKDLCFFFRVIYRHIRKRFFYNAKKLKNLSPLPLFLNTKKGSNCSIPKIIHQIWFGTLPSTYEPFIQKWKALHPDWEYYLWTEENITELPLRCHELFHSVTNPGMRSDILRYELLYLYGGLYIDVDFEPLWNFDRFHRNHKMYTGCYISEDQVYNALIGSTPKHPLLNSILDHLLTLPVPQSSEVTNAYVINTTGPVMFTHAIKTFLKSHPQEISIYPEGYFYPLHCRYASEVKRRNYKLPSWMKKILSMYAYAIHYYGSNWKTEE